MKKSIIAIIMLCVVMNGCGKSNAPAAEVTAAPSATPTSTPTPEPTAYPTREPTEEPTTDPTDEPTPEPAADPDKTLPEGPYDLEIKRGEINTKTPVATVNDANITLETGPIVISIDAFQISNTLFFDEEYANILEVPFNQDFAMITMYLTIENTSDEDIDFLPMPTIITNTKEQSEGSWTLSDELAVTYRGQVIEHPFIAYNLDYSDPEEIREIELRFIAPTISGSPDRVGEEITYTIRLDDFNTVYGSEEN